MGARKEKHDTNRYRAQSRACSSSSNNNRREHPQSRGVSERAATFALEHMRAIKYRKRSKREETTHEGTTKRHLVSFSCSQAERKTPRPCNSTGKWCLCTYPAVRSHTHTKNRMTTRQQAWQSVLRPRAGTKDLADYTTQPYSRYAEDVG